MKVCHIYARNNGLAEITTCLKPEKCTLGHVIFLTTEEVVLFRKILEERDKVD